MDVEIKDELKRLMQIAGLFSNSDLVRYFITLQEFEDKDPKAFESLIKSDLSPKRFKADRVQYYITVLKENHRALNRSALNLEYDFTFSEFKNSEKMKKKEKEIIKRIKAGIIKKLI